MPFFNPNKTKSIGPVKPRLRSPFLLLAFIAGLYSISLGRSLASTGVFQIVGYVLDNSGHPVSGVSISVDDYVGDVYTGATDADGWYLVEVDSDSNYRVAVNCVQLAALGYACVPLVALTVNDGGLEVDNRTEDAAANALASDLG